MCTSRNIKSVARRSKKKKKKKKKEREKRKEKHTATIRTPSVPHLNWCISMSIKCLLIGYAMSSDWICHAHQARFRTFDSSQRLGARSTIVQSPDIVFSRTASVQYRPCSCQCAYSFCRCSVRWRMSRLNADIERFHNLRQEQH